MASRRVEREREEQDVRLLLNARHLGRLVVRMTNDERPMDVVIL